MAELLERVVDKMKALPPDGQDAIASLILEELEDEARWDSSFANNQDLLAKLAAEAMAEDKAGLSKSLDLAEL